MENIVSSEKLLKKIFSRCLDGLHSCLVWQGAIGSHGYGNIRVNGKYWRVHRLVWELTKGHIPTGMFLCHRCDNRACTNVKHLFIGTQSDNLKDMVFKGRSRKGEKHHNCKLTQKQVDEIRERVANGEMQKDLASEFKIGKMQISRIVRHERW